jgi:hypothetical protein
MLSTNIHVIMGVEKYLAVFVALPLSVIAGEIDFVIAVRNRDDVRRFNCPACLGTYSYEVGRGLTKAGIAVRTRVSRGTMRVNGILMAY